MSYVFDPTLERCLPGDESYELIGASHADNCLSLPLEPVEPADPGDFSTGTLLPDDTEHGR